MGEIPLIRKANAAVELDGSILAALRNHIEISAPPKNAGIRKMIRTLDDAARRYPRAILPQFQVRNASAMFAIGHLFDIDHLAVSFDDDKWIGPQAVARRNNRVQLHQPRCR